MRILSLSLDTHVIKPESVVASRIRSYGEAVDLYTVIVPTEVSTKVVLSDKVQIYGVSGFTKLGTFFNVFFCARSLLRKHKYGVITTQDGYFLGVLGVLLSWLYDCGLEVQSHGIEKDTVVRRNLARFVYAQADVVKTVSTRLKNILTRRYKVSLDKIVVIPVFVDVSPLGLSSSGQHTQPKAKNDTFKNKYGQYINICSVSRLVPVKNIQLQLVVLKKLVHTYPHVHLHIVGDGVEKSSLLNIVHTLGLERYVTFHGRLLGTDLGALYNGCDIFVHTANSEGYGMVLIEALHAGLPIVTTDVGCVGEIIHNEKNALVVPLGDTEAFANSLETLIRDSKLRSALSTSGIASILKLQTFLEDLHLKKRILILR